MAVLHLLPELDGGDLGVNLIEYLADDARRTQVGAKFFGEDVIRLNREPWLVKHFVFVTLTHWHFTKVHIGQQCKLVVVVEDNRAVPGDTKVFGKQVTGEDVGSSKVLDGIAIVNGGTTGPVS